jgi:CDP-diacylglycerol--serine O-phosphatidyltransferase
MRKGLFFIPNLFTLGNAFSGFSALVLAAHGEPVMAAYFILLGAILDALDGKIARLIGATSAFGVQIDSLCDAVTFIVAPAFLAYITELKDFGFLGFFASSLFVLAGVSRLARFNVTTQEQTRHFIGLPSLIGGCSIASFFIIRNPMSLTYSIISPYTPLIVAVLAYLMISPLRYPTFKYLSKRSYIWSAVFIGSCIIGLGFITVLVSIFLAYIALGLCISTYNKVQKRFILTKK